MEAHVWLLMVKVGIKAGSGQCARSRVLCQFWAVKSQDTFPIPSSPADPANPGDYEVP